ncbi:hypothetical protein V8D89_001259 [Ganoderma adspersum]
MATCAHVLCFDNSTHGLKLDASTAFDFIKAIQPLRPCTKWVRACHELFNKVLLLNQDHQVNFGPPSIHTYFKSLGFAPPSHQSTPDYLTSRTDPNEQQFTPWRSVHDLEAVFSQSHFVADMCDVLSKYMHMMVGHIEDQEAFSCAARVGKKQGMLGESLYMRSFVGQVCTLATRQFRMHLQDRFQLVKSFMLSTVDGQA